MKPRVRIRDGKVVLQDINPPKPNPEVIEQLEELLERAREGEVVSLVFVAGWHGDYVSRGWAFSPRSHRRIMLSYLTQTWLEWTAWSSVRDGDSVLEDMFG